MEFSDVLKRFRLYIKPHRKKIVLILGVLILEACANLANPMFAKIFIDDVLIGQKTHLLQYLFGAIFIVFFFKQGLSFLYNITKMTVFQKVFFDISLKCTKKALDMSVDYHKNIGVGYLASRIIYDVRTCVGSISNNSISAIINVFTFIVGIFILFYLNAKLSLITITVVPAFAVAAHMYKSKLTEQSKELYEAESRAMENLQETLSAFYTMCIFNRSKYELRKLVRTFSRIIKAQFTIYFSEYKVGIVIGFLATCGPVLLMWFGYLEIKAGNLTLGEYVAFAAYIGMLYGPARAFATINVQLRSAVASATRVFEIIDLQKDIVEIENPKPLKSLAEKIEFRNVGFSYKEKPEWRLEHLNLSIPKGNTIALVGKSGSGKTSIINLLPRFYDVTQGEILVDGVNIKNYKIKDLRKNIGFVSQDTFLFNDTLYNNITYGDLEASKEQVYEACRQADCLDFIESFPEKFETVCGERGVKLSGGQKQRISIARTLLKNPSILILDEATSSLDRHSINVIQRAIPKLMAGRTTIIISHRISTIQHADWIYVLDKGSFVEQGTHDQLLDRHGFYYALCGPQATKTA